MDDIDKTIDDADEDVDLFKDSMKKWDFPESHFLELKKSVGYDAADIYLWYLKYLGTCTSDSSFISITFLAHGKDTTIMGLDAEALSESLTYLRNHFSISDSKLYWKSNELIDENLFTNASNIGRDYSKLMIIINTCYSGDHVEYFEGEKTVIMASCQPGHLSICLGGNSMFLRYFSLALLVALGNQELTLIWELFINNLVGWLILGVIVGGIIGGIAGAGSPPAVLGGSIVIGILGGLFGGLVSAAIIGLIALILVYFFNDNIDEIFTWSNLFCNWGIGFFGGFRLITLFTEWVADFPLYENPMITNKGLASKMKT